MRKVLRVLYCELWAGGVSRLFLFCFVLIHNLDVFVLFLIWVKIPVLLRDPPAYLEVISDINPAFKLDYRVFIITFMND